MHAVRCAPSVFLKVFEHFRHISIKIHLTVFIHPANTPHAQADQNDCPDCPDQAGCNLSGYAGRRREFRRHEARHEPGGDRSPRRSRVTVLGNLVRCSNLHREAIPRAGSAVCRHQEWAKSRQDRLIIKLRSYIAHFHAGPMLPRSAHIPLLKHLFWA